MHNESTPFEFQAQAPSPDQTPASTEAPIAADQIARIHQAIFKIFRQNGIFEAVVETPEGPIVIGLENRNNVSRGIFRGDVHVEINPWKPNNEESSWKLAREYREKKRQAFRIIGFDRPEGRMLVVMDATESDEQDQRPLVLSTLANFANNPEEYRSGWIIKQQ